MRSLITVLLVTLTMKCVICANILCLMGVPSPSHHIWNRALMEVVAKNEKNNLTIVSCDVEQNAPKNMHYIHLDKMYSHIYNDSSEPMDLIAMAKGGPIAELMDFYKFAILTAEGLFKSKTGLSKILSYPKSFKFDLVIYDFTIGPFMLGILKHFEYYPPVVSVTAFMNPPYTPALIGGHKYPAYIPYYSLSYSTSMNFWQRCHNTFMYAADALYRRHVFLPQLQKLMREQLQRNDIDVQELEEKTMLMFVNSHPATDFSEPLPPNIIPVGGLQIKTPKPLPEDLNTFIRAGKKGAVLVSLGTNIRSDMLDQARLKMFLKAMEQIPDYNFVWKFESDSLPPQPKNVQIRPWMPQNDILGHPNVKGFVSHAGGLSTIEAHWYGIPMVGIPFIADQHRNLHKAIENGVAVKVDFHTMTTEKLRNALMKILEDPSYWYRAKLVSQRFRDQPEKPIDRAAWLLEWALRNPTPDHLTSPTIELGSFRSNLYDIHLLVVAVLAVLVYTTNKFINSLKKRVSKPTKSSKKQH